MGVKCVCGGWGGGLEVKCVWRLGGGEGADNVGGQLHSLISTEPFRGR